MMTAGWSDDAFAAASAVVAAELCTSKPSDDADEFWLENNIEPCILRGYTTLQTQTHYLPPQTWSLGPLMLATSYNMLNNLGLLPAFPPLICVPLVVDRQLCPSACHCLCHRH